MKAKLIKIENTRVSRNGDVAYKRLKFTLQDGTFAMTDVVSSFRNFKYWRPVIESGIGTYIDGVEMKSPEKINADSQVRIIGRPVEVPRLPI